MREGKIVAISGAAGGLGPTVARAFFEAGATLCVGGRSMEGLTRMLDLLHVPAARRMATAVDLLDASAAKEWADAIQGRLGRVDIVLHLVGGYKGGASIAELDPADWSSLSDMLVRTTLNVARAFAGPLKAGGWGRFIAVRRSWRARSAEPWMAEGRLLTVPRHGTHSRRKRTARRPPRRRSLRQ